MRLPEEIAAIELATNPQIVRSYAEFTSDYNPIHLDEAFAAETSFGRPIVHGAMTVGLLMRALELTFEDGIPAGDLQIRFTKPVPVGSSIVTSGRLTGPSTYDLAVDVPGGETVLKGTFTID